MAHSAAIFARQDSALARDHLIVALDVSDLAQARDVVARLGDDVLYYKVGPHLFLSGLIDFIQKDLLERGNKVFLLQKRRHWRHHARNGCSCLAARHRVHHRYGSTATITAAREGRNGSLIPKILAVTLLTDHDEADMQREFGTQKTVAEFVVDRALVAEKARADGVISSPQEIAAIRQAVQRPGFLIVTPGVRPLGASTDDQKRTATPAEAITAGADYLVVGRPILREFDKLRATRRILDEMQTALDAR